MKLSRGLLVSRTVSLSDCAITTVTPSSYYEAIEAETVDEVVATLTRLLHLQR